LAVAIIVVVVSGFVTSAYTFHWFGLGTINCWSRPSNVPSTSAYFVVVMASRGLNAGFNGSMFHSGSWPVMNVTLGQNVWIHVVSNDTIQSHGFAIVTYFNRGLTLGPGACNDVTFTANQLGSFRVYCYVVCTVHPSMQNGEVNVNP
jgi:heme/copper-type cytochrome/quinol oxidase subunit 2